MRAVFVQTQEITISLETTLTQWPEITLCPFPILQEMDKPFEFWILLAHVNLLVPILQGMDNIFSLFSREIDNTFSPSILHPDKHFRLFLLWALCMAILHFGERAFLQIGYLLPYEWLLGCIVDFWCTKMLCCVMRKLLWSVFTLWQFGFEFQQEGDPSP